MGTRVVAHFTDEHRQAIEALARVLSLDLASVLRLMVEDFCRRYDVNIAGRTIGEVLQDGTHIQPA